MEYDAIAEVRGVNPRQELEPELIDTAREKYKDLPGAELYEKASADMKQMTAIHNKCFSINANTNEKRYLSPTLTKEELRFLYQIDGNIKSFGYEADPRIQEVIEARGTIKQDLATIFDCQPAQISTARDEALSGNIVFHFGDLNLENLQNAEGLTLPKMIGGHLNLGNLQSAEGLTFPETIGGDLNLENVNASEKLLLREQYPVHAHKI